MTATCTVSTMAPANGYTICGKRRDTTTTSISEFPLFPVCVYTHFFNSPNIPCVKEFGPKHVVIYMACNDSDAIIESIMKNKIFHEECRSCMSNPNAMVMEPAWIRVGMRHCPKELSGTVVSNADQ